MNTTPRQLAETQLRMLNTHNPDLVDDFVAVDYINLVPGTMVVEIDHRRRLLYVHLIDVSSEKKVRAFYTQMETVERLFIRAFERDSEWHPSPYHGLDDEFHGMPPVRSDPRETTSSVPEAKGDRP